MNGHSSAGGGKSQGARKSAARATRARAEPARGKASGKSAGKTVGQAQAMPPRANTAPLAGSDKGDRILEAAVRVFAEKGFYNARVSEIAAAAGVADGTIYLYFKSKDDLLISLFEHRMDEVIDNARAALAEPGTPVERLRRLIAAHLLLVGRYPELAEVLTVELRQSSKFLKEYAPSKFAELLKLIAQPIEAGQADGSIRSGLDAHLAARAIFGALDELVLAWVLAPRAAAGRGSGKQKPHRVGLREPEALQRAGLQLAEMFTEGLRDRSEPFARHDVDESNPLKPSPKRRAT